MTGQETYAPVAGLVQQTGMLGNHQIGRTHLHGRAASQHAGYQSTGTEKNVPT